MKILLHPATPVHVLMIREITNSLADAGLTVDLHAFHLDDWYCFPTAETLESYNIASTGFPRNDPSRAPIWRLKDSAALFRTEYPRFSRLFRRLLLRYQPDVFLIFGDDGLFEAGMLQISRQHNVPSVFIQEGTVPAVRYRAPAENESRPDRHATRAARKLRQIAGQLARAPARLFTRSEAGGGRPKTADNELPRLRPFGLNGATLIAALSTQDARWFVQNGAAADRTIVAGNVLMDRLFRFVGRHADRQRRDTSATEPSRPLRLLVVGSGMAHFGRDMAHRWYVSQIRDMLGATTAMELAISLRLKPGEQLADWTGESKTLPRSLTLLSNADDLYPQIERSDAVVVMNSQVMVEALMIGKPAINLIPPDASEPSRLDIFTTKEAALQASSVAVMLDILRKSDSTLVLDDVRRRNRDLCYQQLFYLFDGQAGARVADIIKRAVQP